MCSDIRVINDGLWISLFIDTTETLGAQDDFSLCMCIIGEVDDLL